VCTKGCKHVEKKASLNFKRIDSFCNVVDTTEIIVDDCAH